MIFFNRKTFQDEQKVNPIEQIQMARHHPLSSDVLSSLPTFIVDNYHLLIFVFKVILGHI